MILKHSIYLIYAEINGVGQWKIGITKNNPEVRFKQLATGNPNLIKIEAVYKVYNDLGYKIEASLKRYFKNIKINGEWLLYDGINANIFLNKCALIENNLIQITKIQQSI